MKIIVVFKWLRNPQDARVGTDGSVDWCGAKMSPNDDDPAAITVAKDLVAGGEIVGLTIADGDVAWAAARGAASTVVVTDAHTEADSAATGAILAAAVHRIGDPDLLLIGDSSWDYGVVSAVVGQLGWPALANVVSAKTEGGRLQVTQKVGAVTRVVEVGGPVVLAVAASRAEQHVPGMKQVLAARKRPVTKFTVADLGISPVGKAISGGTKLPDKPAAKMFDGGDPAAAATQIVAALRTDGVL
jgi:electron transfer flavoprotein beta subunit